MSWRRCAAAMVGLLVIAGCKTAEDATAAATQMSATAKSLSDYYAALGTVLTARDQMLKVREALFGIAYPAASRQEIHATEEELATREAMAADLTAVAGDFAALAGSKAADDVSTACGKLEMEVDGLASHKASSDEQAAIKAGIEALVTAVKAHKEHEVAKSLDQVAGALSGLFDKEAPDWRTMEEAYLAEASMLADMLSDQNAVDSAALLKPALDPFGLGTAPVPAAVSVKLTPLVKQQIADKKTAQLAAYDKASDAMSAALKEMAKRIDLVATEKPMAFRLPPPTIDGVKQWTDEILAK
ncbi:hypothetical protein [Silvibacterium dinghuense]|uniref:DUF3829 domain-containing protein n=1 Tax=Silvibacterium dinghuense TaxID=1560006 RepID=A0A4V1NVS5_9BACT|nr:hypothetical protein [Silvibacterium dinghuense]RXS96942.1 hypothetical protein ESZ00_03125 [Silvibacterium dinghuense]GGG94903.1 hypothetical protein GCM10011586_07340 [Silvibacterium dinghuense]